MALNMSRMAQTGEKRKMAATASFLGRQGTAILGFPVKVKWLLNDSDLGYTVGDRKKGYATVYVAWDFHPITDKVQMDDSQKQMFRTGVFAHELLHQVLTDFKHTNETVDELGRQKGSIFMKFANTLEDPAIEHQASSVFGGVLLEALKYTIITIYQQSPDIDDSPDAFSQLINALINFGDIGVVKGHFTFPESYEYFLKTAPLYNEGIEEKDSHRRIDISRKCFEICRPLWEKYLKDATQDKKNELLDELLRQLASQQVPESEGKSSGGDGNSNSSDDNPGDSSCGSSSSSKDSSKSAQARKRLLESIKKALEEGGQMPDDGNLPQVDDAESDDESNSKGASSENESGNSSGNPDGSAVNDTSENDVTSEEGDGSNASQKAEKDASDTSGEETDDEKEQGSQTSASSDTDASQTSEGGPAEEDNSKDMADNQSEYGQSDTAESYIDFDPDAFRELDELINGEYQKMSEVHRQDLLDRVSSVDIDGSQLDKRASCYDHKAVADDDYSDMYRDIVSANRGKIKKLTRTLSEIFEGDKEEEERTSSGRYNIMRGAVATSSKIFDKRRTPGNKKDMEVVLLIDMSGSMAGSKERVARETAIILGESLMELKIPHYIMGYSSGLTIFGRSYDAFHEHFVTWDSTRKQHESLCGLMANGSNYDSYAIRTATALIKKRPAKNRLIFVITDGYPSAFIYSTVPGVGFPEAGISETKKAIREARKISTLCGIAIGKDVEAEVMKSMYEKDFIHISDEDGLSNLLIKKLAKIVKERFR